MIMLLICNFSVSNKCGNNFSLYLVVASLNAMVISYILQFNQLYEFWVVEETYVRITWGYSMIFPAHCLDLFPYSCQLDALMGAALSGILRPEKLQRSFRIKNVSLP